MLKQFNEIQEYGLKTQKVFECVTIQYIEISEDGIIKRYIERES